MALVLPWRSPPGFRASAITGWGHDSQSIFYSRFQNGITSLWHARILDNSSTQIDTGPYTWIPQLSVSPVSDQIAFLASAPDIPNRIVHWDGKDLQIVARSESETLSPDYFSQPGDTYLDCTRWNAGLRSVLPSPKSWLYLRRAAPRHHQYSWRSHLFGSRALQRRDRLLYLARLCLYGGELPRQHWFWPQLPACTALCAGARWM
jgi:hypothetical protein